MFFLRYERDVVNMVLQQKYVLFVSIGFVRLGLFIIEQVYRIIVFYIKLLVIDGFEDSVIVYLGVLNGELLGFKDSFEFLVIQMVLYKIRNYKIK